MKLFAITHFEFISKWSKCGDRSDFVELCGLMECYVEIWGAKEKEHCVSSTCIHVYKKSHVVTTESVLFYLVHLRVSPNCSTKSVLFPPLTIRTIFTKSILSLIWVLEIFESTDFNFSSEIFFIANIKRLCNVWKISRTTTNIFKQKWEFPMDGSVHFTHNNWFIRPVSQIY